MCVQKNTQLSLAHCQSIDDALERIILDISLAADVRKINKNKDSNIAHHVLTRSY